MWRVAEHRTTALARIAATAVVLLVSAAGVSGCGGSDGETVLIPTVDPTRSTPEKLVLDQIYAQALSNAGYDVEHVKEPAHGETSLEALKSGRLFGYPEHLSTLLYKDLGVEIERLPTRPHPAYRAALARLEERELTAFPPTPFGVANAVALLRTTAEEKHLKTISDLKGKAEEMTVKAPIYCHVSRDCLGGIESRYHTAFAGISYEPGASTALSWWRPEPSFRYEVLEDGESDASMVFTTDGRLATQSDEFVILDDDEHAFPAGNVTWVTSPRAVEEAGPDYEHAIVAAQRGLTLKTMRELDAEVELDGRLPAEVAARYLDSLD